MRVGLTIHALHALSQLPWAKPCPEVVGSGLSSFLTHCRCMRVDVETKLKPLYSRRYPLRPRIHSTAALTDPDYGSAVLVDPDSRSRRLSLQSSPSETSGGVDGEFLHLLSQMSLKFPEPPARPLTPWNTTSVASSRAITM